jgi:predicted Zn finger-like uncharacterized protein
MSRLTRCPACATVFRVTEAQLASRQGFVRCGQCAKVFDARASLLTEAPAPPEEQEPAYPEPQDPAYLEEHEPAYPDTRAPAYPEDTRASASHESESETAAVAQGAAAASVTAGDARAHADAPPATALEGTASEPLSAPDPEYSLAEPEPVPAAFEFGPRHRARSRLAMALWGLGGALALAALVAQAAYWFRTELAMALPGARPHLEAACRAVGCVLPLPRAPDVARLLEVWEYKHHPYTRSVVMFTGTLRNVRAHPIAFPEIELTLLDEREQVVVRKVFGPRDYLPAAASTLPGLGAASEQEISLHMDVGSLNYSKYRPPNLFYR